jgi:hypothetical protein
MPANWAAFLTSWLPFVFLILMWILLARLTRSTNVKEMHKFHEEMQRMNALLERIAVALEKRSGTA